MNKGCGGVESRSLHRSVYMEYYMQLDYVDQHVISSLVCIF